MNTSLETGIHESPWDFLTPRAQQALALAGRHAKRTASPNITTDHLVLALVELGQGGAFDVFKRLKVDLAALRAEAEVRVGPAVGEASKDRPKIDQRVRSVIALAKREAKWLNHAYLGTEHLLLGLLAEQKRARSFLFGWLRRSKDCPNLLPAGLNLSMWQVQNAIRKNIEEPLEK